MRYFISRAVPPFSRVLLVESGRRELFEDLLRGLYEVHPNMTADLVTCYAGTPRQFRSDRGRVYRVTDYPDPVSRKKFYAELAANRYSIAGIICSAEPIMTKWKWMITAQVPAKLFVLNENGDYFWVDYSNWKLVVQFFTFRAGLTGSGAVMTPVRLILLPFTFAFLLLYAAWVHLKRRRIPA